MFENCPLWKRRARGNVCVGYVITFWKDWNYEFSYTDFLSLKEK